jgi:hypothetical protein
MCMNAHMMHIMSTQFALLNPFLDHVSERGRISPERFGSSLSLPLAGVAKLLKVHRNTLSRESDSPLVQERLGEVARIIAAATELLDGDYERAIIWFRHQPLAGFSGETAEQLVRDGHIGAVFTHLEMLRDGVGA